MRWIKLRGLIIKSPWIEKILADEKVWEIRGTNTNIRETIGLIKSGTGKVFGTVELVDSFSLNRDMFEDNKDKHCVEDFSIIEYTNPHVWVLGNVKVYNEPISYKHKNGCVTWVNI